jgi:hypothetical protein
MTDRLITKDFFDPIFQSHGIAPSGDPITPFSDYLKFCRQSHVALDAMLRARDAGDLMRLPEIEGFKEGKAWNDVVDNGIDADSVSKYYASSLIVERITDLVGQSFSKFMNDRGTVEDVDAFKKSLGPLALKLDKWLAHPKQHPNENRLPRNTPFTNDEKDKLGTCYLLQMDGWDDIKVMVRSPEAVWDRAPVVEDEMPEP